MSLFHKLTLDVEEDGHGRPGVLLDEVEPDGGLVGDVLDHPVYAVLHAEEAVGGREWQRRLGGGGGGGRGAMVHVRARRWATITDSPPPLGEGLGFAAAHREEDRFVVWEIGIWVSLSLLWGARG